MRALIVLALVAVPAPLLLAPRAQDGTPAAAHPGGPDSSMAGPTTFAVIGPTAIPATSV